MTSHSITLQVFELEGQPLCFERVANVHNCESEQAAVDKLFASLKSGKFRFLGHHGILLPSCIQDRPEFGEVSK